MVLSPNEFANEHQDDSYEELLELRESLLASIYKYEKENEKKEFNPANFPSPETKYLIDLQCLARICNFIAKRYNEQINEK